MKRWKWLLPLFPLPVLWMADAVSHGGPTGPGLLAGAVWETLVWMLLLSIIGRLGADSRRGWRTAGRFLAGVTGMVALFLAVLDIGYGAYFHQAPDVSTVKFIVDEPENAWVMFAAYLNVLHVLLFLMLAVAVTWVVEFLGRCWLGGPDFLRSSRFSVLLLPPALLLPLLFPSCSGLPVMAHWAELGRRVVMLELHPDPSFGLHRPHRRPLPPPECRPAPVNVLIFLNESLRADAFELLPEPLIRPFDARRLAPHALRRECGSFSLVFPHAYANATATEVSCSSWMTGLPPWESSEHLHGAPLVWDAALAAGRRTFLLSSQDWNWQGMKAFFLGSVQHTVDRRSFRAPHVNDLGVDDALLPDSLHSLLAESPVPFFGVVQFNATHWPYDDPARRKLAWWRCSAGGASPGSRERYEAAVRYEDAVQESCWRVLEASGVLDRTLVIVISDHAESLGERGLGRIACFHEETVRVPFWMHLPRAGLDPAQLAALRAWTRRNVSLLDLAPTLFDLLGRTGRLPELTGLSLLRPPPAAERVIGGQTTGVVNSWSQQGGFALRGREKFVFHGGRGPGLYDLSRDPQERCNLWGDPVRRTRALSWLRPAFAAPGRQALCLRAGVDCPEELRLSR